MSANGRVPALTRQRRLAVSGIALACLLGLVSAPAVADPKQDKAKIDREIDGLRSELHDTSAELADAYIALRRTQAQLPAAQAVLDRASAAQLKADQANDAMTTALAVAQANEARAVDQLDSTNAEIKATRTRVANFAAQMYQEQGMGQLSVAMSATSPDDFATKIAMADTVMGVQNQSIDRLATVQAAATAQKAHVEALRRDVAAAKVVAEKALAAATTARAQAATAKQQLDALAAQQAAQSAALAGKKAAEQARLATAQAEQMRLQAVLVARARAAKAAAAARVAALRKARKPVPVEAPTPSSGFLTRPSDGRISSEFGMRFHPILHYWRLHAGRDFAAACGTPIRAAAPGTVVSAGWGGGYGNRIILDHGIHRGVDLTTTYNHMSRYAVHGGSVARGQIIGYVGTTGSSTGCHLHFETYEDGIPKDPRRWL